ncbi:MAG: DUF1949 domain-containing protein [Proteobacteria bacterium]|nr:DUF1949 domain-containing protein [Pseudomonadota bacterium]MCP4918064.1 DUF1949 domain-containing protein [Pseudomonadota bacterium]
MKSVTRDHVFWSEPIKGSRFRASIVGVESEDAALAGLEAIRRADPDATHHCWAFRLASGGVRCSDDGEPSGTAGRPILARLEGRDLVDVLVVVSRWYGGTKLGAGGLVRAYGRCAGDGLDEVELRVWVRLAELTLTYDYADGGVVDRIVGERDGTTEYGATIVRRLVLPEDERAALIDEVTEATAGRVLIG